MEKLTLSSIIETNWTQFSPELKKNKFLLKLMNRYATLLISDIFDLLEHQSEGLDFQTIFALKGIYHIMHQWCLEIPKILEN